jgi:hypothetical protein
MVGSAFVAAAKPWRQAFRLDCNFPRKVLGPVLFLALIRLAVIFLSELIDMLYTAFALERLTDIVVQSVRRLGRGLSEHL